MVDTGRYQDNDHEKIRRHNADCSEEAEFMKNLCAFFTYMKSFSEKKNKSYNVPHETSTDVCGNKVLLRNLLRRGSDVNIDFRQKSCSEIYSEFLRNISGSAVSFPVLNAKEGDISVLKHLVKTGDNVDSNTFTEFGDSSELPLYETMRIAEISKSEEVSHVLLEFFVENGNCVNCPDNLERSEKHLQILREQYLLLENLIKFGSDVNKNCFERDSESSPKLVSNFLLSFGTDVNDFYNNPHSQFLLSQSMPNFENWREIIINSIMVGFLGNIGHKVNCPDEAEDVLSISRYSELS